MGAGAGLFPAEPGGLSTGGSREVKGLLGRVGTGAWAQLAGFPQPGPHHVPLSRVWVWPTLAKHGEEPMGRLHYHWGRWALPCCPGVQAWGALCWGNLQPRVGDREHGCVGQGKAEPG